MKKLVRKLIGGLSILALGIPATAMAEDFWDNIDYAIYDTGVSGVLGIDADLFGSNVTAQWNDTNGNRDFDPGETLLIPVALYDRDHDLRLQTPASVTTRDELEHWAEENAAEIMDILFGGSISTNSVGYSDDAVMAQTLMNRVVFQKIKPSKVQQMEEINSQFMGAIEYLALDVNEEDGDAYSLVLGFANELDNGLEWGMLLPYRYTDMDDTINSESHYAGLTFYAKKTVMDWPDMDMSLNVGGDIFGSAFYITTDAIDDFGNFKYGAGLFTTVDKNLGFGLLSFGVDYKLSDAYLPDSWIDDDDIFVKEAVDWVNDLDPVHTVTVGFNLGVPIADEMGAVNLEVFRTHLISSDIDDDRDTQTTVGLSCSYFVSDVFELNLGVHGDFEMEDVDIYGVTLGTIYRF